MRSALLALYNKVTLSLAIANERENENSSRAYLVSLSSSIDKPSAERVILSLSEKYEVSFGAVGNFPRFTPMR